MSNTPASAIATSEPWAEVRASDRVMRYRRSGAGPTLLLLGGTAESPTISTELVAALGARFRVIVPEITGESVTTWITEFLEGLGTCEVAILAADHLCMPVIELAFRGIDQIKRLVLIPDGEADDSTSEGAITAAVGSPPIPVLIVRPGLSVGEALPLVTSFLGGA
jgi:hypothetical protein